MNNMSMQDINTSELREMSNHKHGRIISSFEPLALRLCIHDNEGFPLKMILKDHSVPQHLQRDPSRTLGLTSFSLVPARTTLNANSQAH